MKKICFLFFFSFFFFNEVRPQTRSLPDNIKQFYDNKNFVNAFSLKSERDLICLKLLREKELPEIRDARLIRIKEMLLDLSENIISRPDNMSNGTVIPFELLLAEICRIYDWEQSGNSITIRLYTLTICPEDNRKFVLNYSQEKSPADTKKLDMSSLSFLSRQVHEWYFKNNTWYKSSHNIVLVD